MIHARAAHATITSPTSRCTRCDWSANCRANATCIRLWPAECRVLYTAFVYFLVLYFMFSVPLVLPDAIRKPTIDNPTTRYSIPWWAPMASTQRSAMDCVFGISELLNMILESDLHARDLLRAMQVNQAFRKTIQDSTTLARKMGLSPWEPQAPMSPFPADMISTVAPSWFQVTYTFADDDRAGLSVEAHFDPTRSLPTLGSRPRSMLITQPPIYCMTTIGDCCPKTRGRIVACGTGITLGHVYDEIRSLRQAHLYCPWASSDIHRADGSVRVDVRLRGHTTCPRFWKDTARKARLAKHEIRRYIRAKVQGMWNISGLCITRANECSP